ncbi:hypothetical protein KOR34_22010 [Posidoniimonas corsicana]|uniref:DUF1501 domain-containing protein n=2 Tax=Posidoniimonas corsicana TaxID=1938618 RepID=A0A5C5VF34_9BACT|nr:hypothetical protein KOR34_22010 [Posidoniimonas corsicana]
MMPLQHQINVGLRGGRVASRRDFLRNVGAAATTAGVLSWTDRVALAASDLRRRGKRCILLWMAGGPSQFETFSPKPDHENGGATKAIGTSVSGIQIAENLPRIAQAMGDIAIIRSMASKEGSHPRASFLMHHGYLPMGGVKFPTLGANVAHQIGDASSELPSFVRIGRGGQNPGNGGFLGVDYDPLILANADRPPENSRPATDRARYQRRLGLLKNLETSFGAVEGTDVVADHRKLIEASSEMILSPKMEAFDLDLEDQRTRDEYGQGQFASGCLLARRLLDFGVTFVEVTLNGWDTHDENAQRTADLCGQFDQPMAALINDLKRTGQLNDTLVIWMGEFGRTPRINARAGRDHYPRAFNVALAGCGVRGGQVIGQTSRGGEQVTDRPVSPKDLYQTIYTALGIDPDHENMSLVGRPIRLVDDGSPVTELLG